MEGSNIKRIIYADHAATTPLSSAALSAMLPFMEMDFYNPSTKYAAARRARQALGQAREQIAGCIGASTEEIFFTAGGTESDNWAIKGSAFCYPNQKKRIITSQIEHHAVLRTCSFLQRLGYEVEYLPVNIEGLVDVNYFEKALNTETILASIMLANNEIGTIEPIDRLAELAHRHHILFHTDAVQAIGNIPVDVRKLNVDMLSASAHKFGGPKGIGFLYVKKGVKLEALLSGGGQENGLRAGTENVASIVGMAAALADKCARLPYEYERLLSMRKVFVEAMHETEIPFLINGSDNGLPGTISLSIKDEEGERLLHRLDLMGVQVATGSACDSQETKLSHVLDALKLPEDYVTGTIRISFGAENTVEDVIKIVRALEKIIHKRRRD